MHSCKKAQLHLMPLQKQFMSTFPVGTSFKVLNNKTDTLVMKVVKNTITTRDNGCYKTETGNIEMVNQKDTSQKWTMNMLYEGDILIFINSFYFSCTYEQLPDTVIGTIHFSQPYKFISSENLDYQVSGILAMSVSQGFAYMQYYTNNDTIIYERLP